jgi:hypothetical protein
MIENRLPSKSDFACMASSIAEMSNVSHLSHNFITLKGFFTISGCIIYIQEIMVISLSYSFDFSLKRMREKLEVFKLIPRIKCQVRVFVGRKEIAHLPLKDPLSVKVILKSQHGLLELL